MCLPDTTSRAVLALASKESTMQTDTHASRHCPHQRRAAEHGRRNALSADELRQRACSELLRQAAHAQRLAGRHDDVPGTDGVLSEAASAGHRDAAGKEPGQCPNLPRKPAGATTRPTRAAYSTGERVHVRHILFAVTPGVDVVALRKRAEATLAGCALP